MLKKLLGMFSSWYIGWGETLDTFDVFQLFFTVTDKTQTQLNTFE